MLEFNGKLHGSVQDRVQILKYWIEEREGIRREKQLGKPKPWSNDPVFQTTYFCNVRREDDKVTRFIRDYYSSHVKMDYFEFNILIARLINWPPTLQILGVVGGPNMDYIRDTLNSIDGKVWGDAYIVSTCGRSMPKVQYLTEILLPAAYERLGGAGEVRAALRTSPSLRGSHRSLLSVFGVQSFMAGQIIADLKNTVDHPLYDADDWSTWATPGPGSLRGISWIFYGDSVHREPAKFPNNLAHIRMWLVQAGCDIVMDICSQDLQNCLCEFDKYCRVRTGAGRSKRGYPGA